MYFNFMAAITSALSLEPKRIKSVTNAYVPLSPDSCFFFFVFPFGELIGFVFQLLPKVNESPFTPQAS